MARRWERGGDGGGVGQLGGGRWCCLLRRARLAAHASFQEDYAAEGEREAWQRLARVRRAVGGGLVGV